MLKLADRIRALEEASPATGFDPGGALPRRTVEEAVSIFSDRGFPDLPMERQSSFLDFVQAAYISSYDPSAPRMAVAIQRVFQAHLSRQAPLNRLLKTYDLLYFLYWCAATSIEQQRGFDTDVVMPFSRYLKPRRRPVHAGDSPWADRPIRLCYLAEFAHDGGGNALATVVETLMSSLSEYHGSAYELFLYGWMYKDPVFLERIKAYGVTVRAFDLSEYAERQMVALRQAFFDDRIDVAVTDMNSAVPHYLFERRVAPVQIFYQLGLPFWRLQNLDAVFQGWQIDPEGLGFEPVKCHAVPAPKAARNLNLFVDPERVRVERRRFPESARVIGFYGRLVKITPVHCEIVRRILQRHPNTIAVLGGTGNALPILNFIRENGLEQRLFVVNEFVDGHVWGHLLDVFLDTFPLTGGYSCREVLAKGKPIVHMRSEEMPNLNTFLDPELEAARSGDYVARVSRLLDDEVFYLRACERAMEISREQADLRPFASTFHAALQDVLSRTANPMTSDAEIAKTLAMPPESLPVRSINSIA